MKVSIITATYNSAKTLSACLDSVASQTKLANIEHIIVDGRSSDETLTIAGRYAHINQIISAPDRGIYHAFNRGLAIANGEIVYFLNSDDSFYDQHVLEDVLNTFEPETDFYCGTIFCVDQTTGNSFYTVPYLQSTDSFKPRHQAFFCRKRVFDKLGPFNECLNIAADTYFMKKAMNNCQGVFTERVVAKFSLLGMSCDDENRADVLTQDLIVDTLLGLATNHEEHSNKLATQLKNLSQLKQLMLKAVQDSLDLTAFMGKRIAIFGTRELSLILGHLISRHGAQLICYVVSSNMEKETGREVPVIGLPQLAAQQVDLVINCIEGEHESAVAELIERAEPNATVVSWRYFCE
ncbi:glycosyltransferase family 2 protein [Bowmanella pacifica]|uniref:Glycosyltransferase 2-like domain-containing protein n=1 Tax=Bowmanella pacifica TaxID=502051 RepID=A0A917Z647_9ALTE|nr:glycosyltransferase family 2 protein [Bowmanella pacifica]GGO73881.1 hypothetical protein GCM10010982_35440 [Bowmanella pacifica]